MFTTVVCVGLLRGSEAERATFGFIAGLCISVAVFGPLGLVSFVLVIVGYFAGRYAETADTSSGLAPIVVVAVGTAVAEVLFMLSQFLAGPSGALRLLLRARAVTGPGAQHAAGRAGLSSGPALAQGGDGQCATGVSAGRAHRRTSSACRCGRRPRRRAGRPAPPARQGAGPRAARRPPRPADRPAAAARPARRRSRSRGRDRLRRHPLSSRGSCRSSPARSTWQPPTTTACAPSQCRRGAASSWTAPARRSWSTTGRRWRSGCGSWTCRRDNSGTRCRSWRPTWALLRRRCASMWPGTRARASRRWLHGVTDAAISALRTEALPGVFRRTAAVANDGTVGLAPNGTTIVILAPNGTMVRQDSHPAVPAHQLDHVIARLSGCCTGRVARYPVGRLSHESLYGSLRR